jgi:hypothetical protein
MKYLVIFLCAFCTCTVNAQTKGHGKVKMHHGKKNAGVIRPSAVIPIAITNHFSSNYPGASQVNWSNKGNNYMARYMSGPYWTTTTYTPKGTVVETKTFMPAAQAPKAVMIYKNANPSFVVGDVIKLELPGKQPVYQVQVENGQYVYLNDIGLKVKF